MTTIKLVDKTNDHITSRGKKIAKVLFEQQLLSTEDCKLVYRFGSKAHGYKLVHLQDDKYHFYHFHNGAVTTLGVGGPKCDRVTIQIVA